MSECPRKKLGFKTVGRAPKEDGCGEKKVNRDSKDGHLLTEIHEDCKRNAASEAYQCIMLVPGKASAAPTLQLELGKASASKLLRCCQGCTTRRWAAEMARLELHEAQASQNRGRPAKR